mmetsp:Transcript_59184/g.110892  ORF Transcript_59184/g.110892 Transcript_59184/m.110892 type:complete len:305 (+) Transcript_59184:576-1490(+)
MVPVNGAHHGGWWPFKHQSTAALPLQLLAVLIEDCRLHPEERQGGGSRLADHGPYQRGDQVAARLRLPIGVCNGTLSSPDHPLVPPPGFGVDGLPNTSQKPQTRQIVPGHRTIPRLHQGTNGCGRSVESADLVLLADLPKAIHLWMGRDAFEEDLCGCVEHGTVGHVGMPRDPAAICGAEVDVLLMDVKGVLRRGICSEHVAACSVEDTFGLASAAGCVEHEERGLAVHPFTLTLRSLSANKVRIPNVSAIDPPMLSLCCCRASLQAGDANNSLDYEALFGCNLASLICDCLQLHWLRAAHDTV